MLDMFRSQYCLGDAIDNDAHCCVRLSGQSDVIQSHISAQYQPCMMYVLCMSDVQNQPQMKVVIKYKYQNFPFQKHPKLRVCESATMMD